MYLHPAFRLIFFISMLLPAWAAAQTDTLPDGEAPHESQVILFRQVGVADTTKTMLEVHILEENRRDPIQGATVLLRRDKDKMVGKVSKADGIARFTVKPSEYTLRVQMTGLKSIEQGGFVLEAGKVYRLDLAMAKN
jgi:hypothetical protein